MRATLFWNAVAFLCGIGFTLFFVLLATLDQPVPAPWVTLKSFWGTYLYNYQTLIAGILAVFAAAIAVSQSVAADAEQNRRHREQMFLSQRRDLFAIGRLTNDLITRLKYVADRSAEFAEYEIANSTEGWTREARTTYLCVLRSASRLFDKLDGIGDLERGLFDAELEVAFGLYRRQLEELVSQFPERKENFPDFYPNSDHAPAKFNTGIRESCIGLKDETTAFSDELRRWEAKLKSVYQS
jgi:hypothetical protein